MLRLCRCAGFSLVVVSRGLLSSCSVHRLLICSGFSCGSWALNHRLNSCGTPGWLSHGMWDLSRSGIKAVSPARAGGFFTTEAARLQRHGWICLCWQVGSHWACPSLGPGEGGIPGSLYPRAQGLGSVGWSRWSGWKQVGWGRLWSPKMPRKSAAGSVSWPIPRPRALADCLEFGPEGEGKEKRSKKRWSACSQSLALAHPHRLIISWASSSREMCEPQAGQVLSPAASQTLGGPVIAQ